MTDLVPDSSVPGDGSEQDHGAVAGEKKQVTQRQFEMAKLGGANTSMLEVVTEGDVVDAENEYAENGPGDPDERRLEDEDAVILERIERERGLTGDEDEVTDTTDETGGEEGESTEAPETDDSTLTDEEMSDDEWQVKTFGNTTLRINKASGLVQHRRVVDGEELWLNDDVVVKGDQFGIHNDRKAQDLAAREKEIAEREAKAAYAESFDASLNRILGKTNYDNIDPAAPSREFDDFTPFGESPSTPAPVDANTEARLARLEQENAQLKQQDVQNAALMQDAQESARVYSEAMAYAQKKGYTVPTDAAPGQPSPRVLAQVSAYAANNNLDPTKVMRSPLHMSNVMDVMGRDRKPSGKPKIPVGNKAAPPPTESPRKGTPELAGKQKAAARHKTAVKNARDVDRNPAYRQKDDMEVLRAGREAGLT